MYASDYRVDISEAYQRLQIQDSIQNLESTLAAKEQNAFAGVWIQHTPEFRIVVQLTQGGIDVVQPYVEDKALVELIEVRKVSTSLAALQSEYGLAKKLLKDGGIAVDFGINLPKNKVEVYVTDRKSFTAALERQRKHLPAMLKS